MADEVFVLEVNVDEVPVRHGDDETTSVRCPYDLLLRDVMLPSEELLIHICKDANDKE